MKDLTQNHHFFPLWKYNASIQRQIQYLVRSTGWSNQEALECDAVDVSFDQTPPFKQKNS